MLYIYLLVWSICLDCPISKRCTRPRRFPNPSFKSVRNADSDVPFAFVVGIAVAVAVAQIATKTKKSFVVILSPDSIVSSRFSSLRSSGETRSRCHRFIVNLKSTLQQRLIRSGGPTLASRRFCT